jgi:hypothetical protein
MNCTGAVRAGRQYTVRDLWLHEDVGTAIRYVHVSITIRSRKFKLKVRQDLECDSASSWRGGFVNDG